MNVPQASASQAGPSANKHRSATISEIVRAGACIGCGGCAVASEGVYTIRFTPLGLYQAGRKNGHMSETDEERFSAFCPFSNRAENEDEIAARVFPEAPHIHPAVGKWESAYVGSVSEGEFRARGSSGGMMSWLLAELLRRDSIDGVIHVVARTPTTEDRRLFNYRISRTADEVREGAKSRYYPIEFSAVLAEVRATPGRYAFVGLPCFIKAVRLLMKADEVLRSRVKFCVGLFCGHLKSAALVDSFALQSAVDPGAIASVDFRLKQARRRADVYTVCLTTEDGAVRERDWSQMADGDWGMGFFQYSACNYCDDVMAETADIAFGDAWVPPYSADGRGTNVVVARTAVLAGLLGEALREKRLELASVDGEFLARTQAAGLRQRREGLAYRLHRRRGRFVPRKRVLPDPCGGGWKRRRIYGLRMAISRWSHPVFAVARTIRMPLLYRAWARSMGKIYRAVYWLDRGSLTDRLRIKLRSGGTR